MPLKNDQYNALMREYSMKKLRSMRALEDKKKKIYASCPRLLEIHNEIASNASKRARAGILHSYSELPQLLSRDEALREEQHRLLNEMGLSEADLTLKYECPDCRDTGFKDGKKCHCFLQAAVNLLYDQSGIRSRLLTDNFSTLRMDMYRKDAPPGKRSQFSYMEEKILQCREYAENFDLYHGNLLFYGPTGTGKTFLSGCIAKELIETCHSVVYLSSHDLFELFADARFKGDEDAKSQMDQYILESDLLIIDDLGTEQVNAFTVSELFYTVNARLNLNRSMIISTNLDPGALTDTYSDRVSSRITSSFSLIRLFGEDLRMIKKYGKK